MIKPFFGQEFSSLSDGEINELHHDYERDRDIMSVQEFIKNCMAGIYSDDGFGNFIRMLSL